MVVDDVDGPLGGKHLLHRLHVHLARAHQRAVPRTVVQVNQHACKEKSGLLSHLHKGCLILPQRKGRLGSPIGPPLGGARVPGCRSCAAGSSQLVQLLQPLRYQNQPLPHKGYHRPQTGIIFGAQNWVVRDDNC